MKVRPEHLQSMRDAIESVFDAIELGMGLSREEVREKYRRREIPRGSEVKDIDVRFRWDLYWASSWSNDNREAVADYSTAHIDTALRNIVPPL